MLFNSRLPIFCAAFGALIAVPGAKADPCPAALERATRLVMITVANMHEPRARLRKFERAAPGSSWTQDGATHHAVVGARGIGWGHPFRAHARHDEPTKREGDRRTPAGIYKLGANFGVAKSRRPNYLQLTPGANFCVEDTQSRLYGHIVPRSTAGNKVKGQEMAATPAYRRGIVIDYPPNRKAKAGSCIFVHIWKGAGTGTSGCVALPEARVAELQEWTKGRIVAIAIVAEDAVPRFGRCLPSPVSVEADGARAALPAR